MKLSELQENTDRQLNKIRKRVQEQNEKFNKEIKIIKKNQTEILELRNIITKLKSLMKRFNNRLNQAEESESSKYGHSKLPNRSNRKKSEKVKIAYRNYRSSLSKPIYTLLVFQKKQRKKEIGEEILFKEKQLNTFQIWIGRLTCRSMKPKAPPHILNIMRLPPRHIIIKFLKIEDKKKILQAEREKQREKTFKGTPIRVSVYFSVETLQVKRN